MRVLLIGNYLPDNQRSMLGFANALSKGLCDSGIEIKLISPSPVLGKGKKTTTGTGKWLGYVDKYVLFRHSLRSALDWADIVHICDHSNAVYVSQIKSRPHLITCHDLLAVRSALGELNESKVGRTGKVLQKWILSGLNQAQNIVCDTEATRQDVLRLCTCPSDHVFMQYQGLHFAHQKTDANESVLLLRSVNVEANRPYLFHLGGNQFYKNRMGVLRIFAEFCKIYAEPYHLYMAGQPFTAEMHQFVIENQLETRVSELVGLDNEKIRALFSHAQALVFPSWYEGFGLPVIEAMACGCPVFTSNRAPMTETGGDAAIYFDPAVPQEAAKTILHHLPARDQMIEKGYLNVNRFTQKQMIDGYIKLYHQILTMK